MPSKFVLSMITAHVGTPPMTVDPIRVVVTGATGYVGRALVAAILQRPDFHLVAAVSRTNVGRDVGVDEPSGVHISNDIHEALAAGPQVLIDYSAPEPAMKWYRAAVEAGVAVVAATTALDPTELGRVGDLAAANGVGVFVASNLTTTGHLMMRCAELVAGYVGDVEIVEGHPSAKPDSPSGTARETAARINAVEAPPPTRDETRLGARESRGAQAGRVRIHSLRLPGLVDHQEVIFSRPGELLTIRTESMSPAAFVEPTLQAAKLVLRERGLVHDLPGIYEPQHIEA